jgi:hypothetical protein
MARRILIPLLVPPFDLKFLIEFAARDAGTSNRRHQNCGFAGTLCFPKFVYEDAEPDYELRKAGTR